MLFFFILIQYLLKKTVLGSQYVSCKELHMEAYSFFEQLKACIKY